MDRFGDDMCELILSHLILADKVRLECVSKQWKRCVFQRQFEIFILRMDINDIKKPLNRLFKVIDNKTQLDKLFLESFLKKCPNITTVDIGIEMKSEVLSLFGQYCPNMRSLTLHRNCVLDLDFFSMYGYRLEELTLHQLYQYDIEIPKTKQFLNFCPNIKKVYVCDNSVLLDQDKEFLPKLEQIPNIIWIRSMDVNNMKIFGDKYSKTMKTLKVWFLDQTYDEVKTCLMCITKLEELRELELLITIMQITEPINDCLILIGQKCTKLLKFRLDISIYAPLFEKFFDIFQYFKGIKKLKLHITSTDNTVLPGSVESFKHCKQLKSFDIFSRELTEHFFINLKKFLPQLKFLNICTEKQFSNSFIVSYLSMNSIQRVVLTVTDKPKNRVYEKFWYFGQCLSKLLSLKRRRNFIRVNNNCVLVKYELAYK